MPYPQVLELYCETAKRILCYFTPSESKALYEASLALVRTYASHQVRSCVRWWDIPLVVQMGLGVGQRGFWMD